MDDQNPESPPQPDASDSALPAGVITAHGLQNDDDASVDPLLELPSELFTPGEADVAPESDVDEFAADPGEQAPEEGTLDLALPSSMFMTDADAGPALLVAAEPEFSLSADIFETVPADDGDVQGAPDADESLAGPASAFDEAPSAFSDPELVDEGSPDVHLTELFETEGDDDPGAEEMTGALALSGPGPTTAGDEETDVPVTFGPAAGTAGGAPGRDEHRTGLGIVQVWRARGGWRGLRVQAGATAACALLAVAVALQSDPKAPRALETVRPSPTVTTPPITTPLPPLSPLLGLVDQPATVGDQPAPDAAAPGAPGAPAPGGPTTAFGAPRAPAGPFAAPASGARAGGATQPPSGGGAPAPSSQQAAAPAPAPAPAARQEQPAPQQSEPAPAPEESNGRRTREPVTTTEPPETTTTKPAPPTTEPAWVDPVPRPPATSPPPPPPTTASPTTTVAPEPTTTVAPSTPRPTRPCVDGDPPRPVPC